jgi:hypothetical protein
MKSQRKPQFFLAKSARLGSKKWHQKYISTIKAQSFYAKILSITNNFTSAKKILCIKYVLHFNGPHRKSTYKLTKKFDSKLTIFS